MKLLTTVGLNLGSQELTMKVEMMGKCAAICSLQLAWSLIANITQWYI
jgi:hypothetical protein